MTSDGDPACFTPGVNSTPEELAAQAQAVAVVRAARIQRDQARLRLEDAIRAAYAANAHVRDIAHAAGMSRQRVHQIIRGQ